MQKIVRTSMLGLALAITVHAGEMGNGVTNTPQPQTTSAPQATTETTSTVGEMGNPQMDVATEAALNLLQNLLALF